jgi:hypothetical protein
MTRTTACMLCGYTSEVDGKVRTDNIQRHVKRTHCTKEDFVGFKPVTGYTFHAVGSDYPHLFVGQKDRQYVGYCMECYHGSVIGICNSLESAMEKHKPHTCAGKQYRPPKEVTLTTKDASGNIVLKKEMQTGGVRITEEMLLQYKKRPEMRYIELETNETCDVEVLASIENALKDSSKLKSPAMKAALAPKPEPVAAPVATSVVGGEVDWAQVCKELSAHRRLKTYFPASMAAEEARVQASIQASLTDPDETADELDWYDFIAASIYKGKTVIDVTAKMRKLDDEAKSAVERAEAKATMLDLQITRERESAARREAERDEEIRMLRAALQQREENNQMLRAALEKCKSQQVISHE